MNPQTLATFLRRSSHSPHDGQRWCACFMAPHPQRTSLFSDGCAREPAPATSLWESSGYLRLRASISSLTESSTVPKRSRSVGKSDSSRMSLGLPWRIKMVPLLLFRSAIEKDPSPTSLSSVWWRLTESSAIGTSQFLSLPIVNFLGAGFKLRSLLMRARPPSKLSVGCLSQP
jgi:hypothetical protein